MKPTAVLFALSIVSLTLAASAVFMSQHGSPPTPVTTTPVAVDTTALEESVARLAEEVDSLRARVAAVEQPPTAVADGEPSADGLPVETRDLDGHGSRGQALDLRITKHETSSANCDAQLLNFEILLYNYILIMGMDLP